MGFSLSNLAGNLTGGLIGESDAEKAAKKAGKLSTQTQELNIEDFTKALRVTQGQFTPYMKAGAKAISDLMDQRFGDPEVPELATFAYPNPEAPEFDVFRYATPETPELEKFVFDATQLGGTDAYKWRYEQGLEATERAIAGDRDLGSGNRLTALTRYGQGEASQEFDNEWGRQLTTNLEENRRRTQEYEMDVNRFSNERTRWMDENQRRQAGYENDISRYGRAFGETEYENERRMATFGAEQDRYRSTMDRLFGLARGGQNAAGSMANFRGFTTGGITGARGQNAANQFASSLVPVQEKQQYIGGAFDLAGQILGRGK
jgi:hypothetical protein